MRGDVMAVTCEWPIPKSVNPSEFGAAMMKAAVHISRTGLTNAGKLISREHVHNSRSSQRCPDRD